jgi:hypothetical protein
MACAACSKYIDSAGSQLVPEPSMRTTACLLKDFICRFFCYLTGRNCALASAAHTWTRLRQRICRLLPCLTRCGNLHRLIGDIRRITTDDKEDHLRLPDIFALLEREIFPFSSSIAPRAIAASWTLPVDGAPLARMVECSGNTLRMDLGWEFSFRISRVYLHSRLVIL